MDVGEQTIKALLDDLQSEWNFCNVSVSDFDGLNNENISTSTKFVTYVLNMHGMVFDNEREWVQLLTHKYAQHLGGRHDLLEEILCFVCVKWGFCGSPNDFDVEGEDTKFLMNNFNAEEFSRFVLSREGMVPEHEITWTNQLQKKSIEVFGTQGP